MYPLITIITVCFNAINGIEETILNVLNLNYPNINFIIIDGGSTDGTVDVITSYSDRLSYYISEPDAGIYDAMNKGWVIANPQSYILYLGAGDKILNLPKFNGNSDTIIVGNVQIGNKYLFKSKLDFRLKLGNTLHHQALLIPKKLHINAPFSLDYKIYSDFDFNQRLLKASNKFLLDDSFVGYAAEDGVSAVFNSEEPLKIIYKNYGHCYKLLARFYYYLQHKLK